MIVKINVPEGMLKRATNNGFSKVMDCRQLLINVALSSTVRVNGQFIQFDQARIIFKSLELAQTAAQQLLEALRLSATITELSSDGISEVVLDPKYI